ncbi:uncharacterized protein ASCRUDRAFT_76234 [Ascoidea rubescens DSM 1968]|uniref:Uncharacterized protein n=1 Tax=Ascoidea rubescens DSM 1968 TaxID=1344418 RepID=A0A1D2VGU4_9ASCO|nr:hypothetical protein ASCRUDRAFT_76234 [Ascoidea rubescens DSM 1968]ODV60878.1 hypothetical protein ASCRUDRAFT_76234 [Ascoidea rubescens DSM 1968]
MIISVPIYLFQIISVVAAALNDTFSYERLYFTSTNDKGEPGVFVQLDLGYPPALLQAVLTTKFSDSIISSVFEGSSYVLIYDSSKSLTSHILSDITSGTNYSFANSNYAQDYLFLDEFEISSFQFVDVKKVPQMG